MRKSLLWLLITVLAVAMIATFSLAGCKEKEEVAPVEEETAPAEEVEEEAAPVEEEAAPAEPYEIAVLFPGTVEFFSIEQQGVDAAAEDYGVNVTYADAEWDAGKQLSQVENYIAMGVDAILLCAGDSEALIAAVEACNNADIPLLTFTNTVGPNPDGTYEGVISFIGTNEVTVGNLLGEEAELLLGDVDGKIVIIEGNPGTSAQRLRREGFDEVLAEHDNWEVVYSQAIEGWTKEGSLAMMEDFIQTGQEFNFVSCQWSTAAIAAAQALTEADMIDDVYVASIEITNECLPFIMDGSIDMLSFYSVEDVGYLALETTVKYLNGEDVPEFIEVVPVIVSIDNIDTITPEM